MPLAVQESKTMHEMNLLCQSTDADSPKSASDGVAVGKTVKEINPENDSQQDDSKDVSKVATNSFPPRDGHKLELPGSNLVDQVHCGKNSENALPHTESKNAASVFVRKFRRLAVVVFSFVLIAIVVIATSRGVGRNDYHQGEFFVGLSFEDILHEVVPIPFETSFDGKNNRLSIRLSKLGGFYLLDNRLFVVINGDSVLSEKSNGAILETVQATLRLSFAFSMKSSRSLVLGDAKMGSFSIYSDNPATESLRERNECCLWDDFCKLVKTWEQPLDSLSFTPRPEVQLEKDGLFVFAEEPAQ